MLVEKARACGQNRQSLLASLLIAAGDRIVPSILLHGSPLAIANTMSGKARKIARRQR